MENEKNSEEHKRQTMQMFNITEVPVMNYISKFLEESFETIFKDQIPKIQEPFILLPLEDYKKRICLKYHLIPINPDGTHEQINNVPISDLLKYEKVREGIGFLFYCIKNVYPAVVHSSMINNKPLLNTQIELDQTNWTFYPKFQHEVSIRKSFLEETLGRILYIQQHADEFDANTIADAKKEESKVISELVKAQKEQTEEIKLIEEKINNEFKNKPRLGIFIEELHESDLPKPIMSEEEDIAAQNANMPKISSSAYTDPEDIDNIASTLEKMNFDETE